MKLVVFDLDQTLVNVITLHDAATDRLFRRLFGVSARLTEIDFAGKSLTQNFAELTRLKGIPEETFSRYRDRIIELYGEIFSKVLPEDISGFVLPGAKRLLETLSETDNVISLYTGGSPGVANRVLKAAGLAGYFRFCQYGTAVSDRADMIGLAIDRARALTGRVFKGRDIVVIGDSVRDIRAGKAFNALTIAVTTGTHSEEELAHKKPDYLFKNLEDTEKVLSAIK